MAKHAGGASMSAVDRYQIRKKGRAGPMRYVGMQLLTWGTIAGAVGSALLLASLDSQQPRYGTGLHTAVPLPGAPTQAPRLGGDVGVSPMGGSMPQGTAAGMQAMQGIAPSGSQGMNDRNI